MLKPGTHDLPFKKVSAPTKRVKPLLTRTPEQQSALTAKGTKPATYLNSKRKHANPKPTSNLKNTNPKHPRTPNRSVLTTATPKPLNPKTPDP